MTENASPCSGVLAITIIAAGIVNQSAWRRTRQATGPTSRRLRLRSNRTPAPASVET
jgi:hypothetical protein